MHAYNFAFHMLYKCPYGLNLELRAPITYAPIIFSRATCCYTIDNILTMDMKLISATGSSLVSRPYFIMVTCIENGSSVLVFM